MDAFLIVSIEGKVLIERYYKNGANRSWIKDYLIKLGDPRLGILSHHETLHPIVLHGDKALIQIVRNDLLLIGLTTQEFPPAVLIDTLHQIADHLGSHFEDAIISEQLVKSHYSSVLALIDEILDYGLPSILEPNALDMLVFEQSVFSHALDLLSPSRLVANVIGSNAPHEDSSTESSQPGNGMGSGSGMGAGSGILGSGSSIWWRRGSGTSNSDDVLVDLVERLYCTVDRNGKVVSSYLAGDIRVASGLSGIPNFKLILKGLESTKHTPPIISFHPSVNRHKWMQDQTINFVPPDKTFTLCQYSMTRDLMVPIRVTANFSFSDCKKTQLDAPSSEQKIGKFELLLQPVIGFHGVDSCGSGSDIILENVRLSVLLPRWVTGITTAQVSSGTVKFNKKQKTLTWSFPKFPLDCKLNFSPKCDGTLVIDGDDIKIDIQSDQSTPTDNRYSHIDDSIALPSYPTSSNDGINSNDLCFPAFLTFWLPHKTSSNLTVDSLEISNIDLPTRIKKLVRCATTAGKIEYRLG